MSTLYFREADVAELLSPAEAVEAVEGSFRRQARGTLENAPRRRVSLDDGSLSLMACVDRELGYAGVKTYAWTPSGTPFTVLLYTLTETRLAAVIEADVLGRLRTGAASGVAVRHLARSGARTLGVIGTGRQAATQVACIRAALPSLERVVVWSRSPERVAAFCAEHGCDPAGSAREAAEQDVVITVTSSREPVLHGEWLRPGALVCAVGANDLRRRELDDASIARAAFVCCDSIEQARIESADLVGPVDRGALDWRDVHELHEVVSGAVAGRTADDDIVVFKSNGLAAWDVAAGARVVELARAAGAGTTL